MTTPHAQSRVVGQRIAAVRQQAGLSIKDLAHRIGWPRDTLVNYELGRRAITMERLAAIAAALDVSPALLLITDHTLATILQRLAVDPTLVSHVAFFLDTMADELPEEPVAE